MTERFTLDRPSFEQVLCATSLIQQLNRRLRNSLTPDNNDIQPLSDLVETQLAIETGSIDLQAAMNRVVGLAVKLSRATGAATWLFTGQEFVYRAGTGTAANSNDERLQLEVLSKLASIYGPSDHSFHDPRESNDWSPALDAIHYPGSVKSLLVAPIFHGRKVAGALAVFSAEFNAFTERDATKARLLSGLLAYALDKAAEAELKQNVSLERAAMLQVIDQLMPALKELAEKDKPESRRSSNRFPSVVTELETVGAAGTILQEAGADVQQSCASTPVLRVAPDGTEPSPLDSPTLQEEKGQTRDIGDNLSTSASLTTEPLRAPESTCAPAPANISTPPIRIQVVENDGEYSGCSQPYYASLAHFHSSRNGFKSSGPIYSDSSINSADHACLSGFDNNSGRSFEDRGGDVWDECREAGAGQIRQLGYLSSRDPGLVW
jgi:GAF domain-containing protein